MKKYLSSMTEMTEMQNMSSDQVCASSVHVVCICDAWTKHDQVVMGQMCKTHNQCLKYGKNVKT